MGDAKGAAQLLKFDSVHERWNKAITNYQNNLSIEGQPISFSKESEFTKVPLDESGVEIILECSGKFKSPKTLNSYLDTLVMKRVVVACPLKGEIQGENTLNIVYGINHDLYEPSNHRLVKSASCTTNCLAPVVKIVNQAFGIKHGCIMTLHDLTNRQVIVDSFKTDLRRARSGSQCLIPTPTGSAKAIGMISPELQGKLNSHVLRAPSSMDH